MPLPRQTLRGRIRSELIELLDDGHYAPGARLDERSLTERLGVSRTPLREALAGMAQEGLLEARPNRGFRVAPLDARVVRDLYPVLGALEALALWTTTADPPRLAGRLHELNDAMQRPRCPSRRRSLLDLQWHETLTGSHDNEELSTLLRNLHRRVRRYDGAFARGLADVKGSCAEHRRIADLVGDRQLVRAGAALEAHWRRGLTVVLDWLESRESAS